MNALQGKVAVITGGSSGIGLATAKRFVEEDAYVFVSGRRKGELEKAVAEIGKNITAIQGDVSNLADLDRLFQTVEKSKKARSTFYSRMRALSNRRRRRPSLLNTMTKHSTSIRGERSSRSRKHCR